jgi:hypothetical protein
MKKAVWVVAVLDALVLAGCAFVPPPPNMPQVSVVNDKYIIVSPEPLVFKVDNKPIDIEWQLPADSRFSFPSKNGVTVDSRQTEKNGPMARVTKEQFDCQLKENTGGKTFRCRNFKVPGYYRYTIRVNDGDKSLTPLDPMIANEP